jgi:hypothetical protein
MAMKVHVIKDPNQLTYSDLLIANVGRKLRKQKAIH